jgi:hypothetical protein
MNDSGKRDLLSRLLKMRMAIVEVGPAETNEEAWLRHLATHPEDLNTNIRIFNHQEIMRQRRDLEIKALEEAAKAGK